MNLINKILLEYSNRDIYNLINTTINDNLKDLNDKLSAKKHLINLIKKIYLKPNDLTLYRIIKSKNNKLNTENLGKHYVMNKSLLFSNDFLHSIGIKDTENLKIITVKTTKENINISRTLQQNIFYSNEEEIFLNSSPKIINIEDFPN